MARRALKVCAEPGCPALVAAGTTRCPEHARTPWVSSDGTRPRRITGRRLQRMRAFVYQRDGGVCWICGLSAGVTDYEVDHVVPLSEGGRDAISNLRVAHVECNRSRLDAARRGGGGPERRHGGNR